MEKSKQGHTTYNNISRNESVMLGLIEESDMPVFDVDDVRALTKWEGSRMHNTLHSLENKNLITRIRRGQYTLTDWVNERLFEIATETVKPSYISFWTALAYYGFTEQQPVAVQIVSVSQSKQFRIGHHLVEQTTWRPNRFYGYRKEGRFVIAEKEKTLVDSLYQPEKCGGLDEYAKCLRNSWDQLDKQLFLEYILRFENRSMVSRFGYLIETLDLDGMNGVLEKHAAAGYVKLDSRGTDNTTYNHKWKVMVNSRLEAEP
ncbi:MAG: type IV toxin-antitoxin system AbiEi family antitoxin [Thermoplasmata archaeon]|nr:type IV toxin-antitoxin system AbiEi family antitoxin [Thermoplasmata archaeon]